MRKLAVVLAASVALLTGVALAGRVDIDAARTATEQALITERAVTDSYIAELETALEACETNPDPFCGTGDPSPSPSVSPSESPSPTQSPSPTPTPAPGCDANVAAPTSIAAASALYPPGAVICLSGTFNLSGAIRPKDGQSFVGPAELVGAGAEFGFLLRVDGESTGAEDVTLVDLDVHGFADDGVACWVGTHVIGGHYHDNFDNGIGCGLKHLGGLTVDGAEVDNNGDPSQLGIGSGGLKFARCEGCTVTNSFVHDNTGNGIWCDVQCGNYVVTNNEVDHNSRKGIHYEKSKGVGLIAGNLVTDNGWEGRGVADWGIRAVSSKNLTIENNVLRGNFGNNGIGVTQDSRVGDCTTCGYIVANVVIRNNTMNGQQVIDCSLPGVTCQGND